MRTVAAIDCGTNSIKLLIGELTDDAFLIRVRESEVVRLGQGVDVSGELSREALERTFAAVERFGARIREHEVPVERVRFCATSASRDASNSAVFVEGVRQRLDVTPEVLSGLEEAALVYGGALGGTRGDLWAPVLVADIGGGSTELVLGEEAPLASTSMDIGSVRLSERHLPGDPPDREQVAACRRDIEQHLDDCDIEIAQAQTIIGTSGTIKTIACGVLELPAYDRDAFDGQTLAIQDTLQFCDELVAMTTEQRRVLPYMHPGRADVIAAGALIWRGILARASVETYVVSEADILHAIARSIAVGSS